MTWPVIAALGGLLSSAGTEGIGGLLSSFGGLLGKGGGAASKFTPEELDILKNYKPADVGSNLNLGMNADMYDLTGGVTSGKKPEEASILDYLSSGKMPQMSSGNDFGALQAKDVSGNSGINQLLQYAQQQQRNPRAKSQPLNNAYIMSLLGG